MSIRLRLTLLYTTILALTLILFSTALYAIHARQTLYIVRQDLEQDATNLLRRWGDLRRSRRGRPPSPGGGSPRADWQILQGLVRDTRVRDHLSLLDGEGNVIVSQPENVEQEFPISARGWEGLSRNRPWMELHGRVGERWMVYNHPVRTQGGIVRVVRVARPLADRDRALRSLSLTLVGGSALATLVAFGAGWLLAGVTLRPIHRITEAARSIGEKRDFNSRVEYAGPKDELGRLAITFNGMLARLQDAYDRVAHSLQLQRDFVTDVSHELRTPLTTVRGNLALLKRAPPLPDEERREILGDLTEESERLSRLVNDLLTLAHADAGREPEIERVDVFELVEDACRQARVLARGRDIRCAARERVVARANADALKQVLLILLDNAVKHAQDPIRVSVEEEDDEVVMRVRDEGPGMAPELQERVFQRFYRGDRSRSTEGFGLGLSIARALLERLDGILEVESAPGEGSTFTVRVPRAVDDSAGQSAG